MNDGTKALQAFLTDLLTNATAREQELPAKVREVRKAIAEDRGLDFDAPSKASAGNGARRCAFDDTILIDEFGRAMSPVTISLSSPKRPVKVTVKLLVWRENDV